MTTTNTITTEQLESLTWTIESVEVDDHQFDEREQDGADDNGELIQVPYYISFVYGATVLRSVEMPSITYRIEWQANGGHDTLADAYDFEVEVNPDSGNTLDVGGLSILDIDGDEIDEREAVRQIGHDIEESVEWEDDARKHLPSEPRAEDADGGASSEDGFELINDHGADVRLSGELVAEASSYSHDGPRNLQWTELMLYRTDGGKFVAHEIGRTRWAGQRTRYTVHVCDNSVDLVKALGYGCPAKELYETARIDHAQTIE